MSFAPTPFRPFTRGGFGGRAADHFRGLIANDLGGRGQVGRGQVGTVVYRSLGVSVNRLLTGVTRDSAGAVLGNCVVDLFQTGNDVMTQSVTSDASGNFTLSNPGSGPFYLVAYKAGSPDVAGTSVNTLVAV